MAMSDSMAQTAVTLLFIPVVVSVPLYGDNSSNSNGDGAVIGNITLAIPSTSPATVEVVPEIVLTFTIIGACALMGIGIAKFADLVYDKHIERYSKKEASEHTRKLLRARVAIMRMKADPKTQELKYAKRAASTWMSKAAGKKEIVEVKDPNMANEIGKVHVPGIRVEVEQAKPHTAIQESPNDKTDGGAESTIVTEFKISEDKSHEHELHPIEKITLRVKPGGPLPPVGTLPPVVVHDLPSHTQ